MKDLIKKLLKESLSLYSEGVDYELSQDEKDGLIKSAEGQYNDMVSSAKKRYEELKKTYELINKNYIDKVMAMDNYSDDDKKNIIDSIKDYHKKLNSDYENAKNYYEKLVNNKEANLKSIYDELYRNYMYKVAMDKHREESMNRQLTKEDIINLFITALEGGSNHWYYIKHIPDKVKYAIKHGGSAGSEAISNYILDGGKIYFYDIEEVDYSSEVDQDDKLAHLNKDDYFLFGSDDDAGYLGYVDMDTLLEGITLLKRDYDWVYENIMMEQYDANDADIFLQLCVMGEVVYG